MRDAGSRFAGSTRTIGYGRRGILAVCCLSMFALVALIGPATSANAAFINQFDFSFDGSDAVGAGAFPTGSIQGMDVDQATGDILVATSGGTIYRFNSAGVSQPFGGGPNTTFSKSVGSYGDIAVDNSGTATQGRIYIVDDSQSFYGFSPSGTALSGYPAANNGETCGIAVGPDGHIWADAYGNQVREYEPTNPPTRLRTVGFSPLAGGVCYFDMDGSGNFLVPVSYSGGALWKYDANGENGVKIDDGPSRGAAADFSNDHIYVNRGDRIVHYDSTGGSPLDTFGLPDPPYPGLQTSIAIAVNETTHAVYVGNNSSGATRIDVFKPVVVPDVVTGESEGNDKVNGTVDPAGAGQITECFFEFGETTNYEMGQAPCTPAAPYNEPKAVSANLPGLLGEQTYHYRLAAKNSSGKGSGGDKTITPHYVVGLKTLDAENVARATTTMRGLFDGNGEETHYYFEWGEDTNYGTKSSVPPYDTAGSPTFPPSTQLTFGVSGLEPDTLYHYRVVAINPLGTSPGNDKTFQTLPAIQSLQTTAASGIGANAATLNGSYIGDGDATSYYFKWGKTTSYGQTTPVASAGSPNGATPLSAPISGLELETTYNYRVVATNSLGTTEGANLTFATDPAVLGLQTLAATGISQDSIQLNAEFNGKGEETHYYFEYGLTNKYGKTTAAAPGVSAGSPNGVTQISAEITDFEAYSTYHYRVVAENGQGITKGPDMTFVTDPAPLPTIGGPTVSDVSPSGATLAAEINPNRWPTVYLFEYGPTTAYGESTEISQPIGSDQFEHSVGAQILNLAPGTMYHVRAVAINFTGTAYSADQTFVTPGVPRIDLTSSSGVGQTTAHLAASVDPNSAATTVNFDYGSSAAYGASTTSTPIGSGVGAQVVGADLAGLAPGTTYHFRTVASNEHGTTLGPDQTFTTAKPLVEQPLVQPPHKKCKKGFVKRNGKCVKKKKKKTSKREGQNR